MAYTKNTWSQGTVITKAALDKIENGIYDLHNALETFSFGNVTTQDVTIGGAAKPVYINQGNVTACSSTVGSDTKPVYMSSGTIKVSSGTVGEATKPVYLSSGTITAGSTYAGGTLVTLNGTGKGASTASFYAPTGAGTAGYLLASTAGTPTWQALKVSSATNTLSVQIGSNTAKECNLVNSVSNTLTEGTSSAAPKIKTTVNGVSGSNITLNTATTDAYGVTKLSSTSSSSEEGLAATPKGVWAAINTLDVSAITGATSKTLTSISETNGKISATYSDIAITSSQITDKGTANGIASLDADGKVPSSQLPSYVDDVLEYTASSKFPSTGETGKIYVDTSTNKSYRWSGSQYVVIASDLALGTTSSTAYRGDYGNTAYKHATDADRLTTAQSSGLYKIATTAHGHIASVTAVKKSDITNLGIPAQDTVYTHPTFTAYQSGLYKITVNNEGHVSAATLVTASDIAPLAESAINTAINNIISNFGLTLQMPSITWTEDNTNGIIGATIDAYQNETTVVIEKEVSGEWVPYIEGDNWAIGDIFRATYTRTATISGQTYTNTLTDTHTTTTEYTAPISEPEEP